jgi:hypothetical protein
LNRVIKFADDINKSNAIRVDDNDHGVDYYSPESWAAFAAKHDIPDGVHPMFWEALQKDDIKDVSAHVRRWVRGILSPYDCALLVMYADVWNEYDFGWVFMEKPSFNYRGDACVQEENQKRFTEIGSRHYKGNPDDCTINLFCMGTNFRPKRCGNVNGLNNFGMKGTK